MKKIFSMATLAVACAGIFISCEDDLDSNPVVVQPQEGSFIINTPSYSKHLVDLKDSENLPFTWSQPVFTTGNAPITPTYEIQVTLDPLSTFSVSYDEAKADKTGTLSPDYAVLPETYKNCNVDIKGESIDRAIMHLKGLEEEDAFNTLYGISATNPDAEQHVYIRVKAKVENEANKKEAVGGKVYASIVSNLVELSTSPYFLPDLDPEIWFFVGPGGIGSWDNAAGSQGEKNIPISVKAGAMYDFNGYGEFVYTGYIAADQFKFVINLGQWEPMWGLEAEGEKGTSKYRDIGGDDPACWKFGEAGYYTLKIVHGKKTQFDLTATKCENQNPAIPTAVTVNVAGTDVTMSKNDFNNHIWYADVTAASNFSSAYISVDGAKIAGSAFPYGAAEKDATEILVKKAGNYRVVYNDLDQCYLFFAK